MQTSNCFQLLNNEDEFKVIEVDNMKKLLYIFNEEYDVTAFDYKSELSWEAKTKFQKYFFKI